MKMQTKKYFWKNVLVQVSTVVAILAIGFFMYSLRSGSLQAQVARVRQLTAALTGALTEVDLIPMPYDAPICTPGTLPVNMMIILSVPDSAAVYITNSAGVSMPAKLNVPFYLPKGTYKLIGQPRAGFAWSGHSAFNFTIDKVCDAVNTVAGSVASEPTVSNPVASSTPTEPVAASSTPTEPPTAPSVPSQPAPTSTPVVPPPVPNVDTTFSLTKNYMTDWSISPTIFKDNVRVYNGVGQVVLQIEVPSSNVKILFGNSDGWMSSGVFGPDKGLKNISGTTRWVLPFDSRKYADGNYRIAGAYFSNADGWKFTGVTDFRIQNTVPIEEVKPPVPVATTTAPATTSKEEYVPTWKPTTTTPASEATFAPTIRLVVDDRQVTALGHVFDRELLEVRATTLPAQSVQFLALSLDGAFKPAIKELGKGGRDELLSRDGKEVWTYSIDMGEFPSGSYRLFARIRTKDNKVAETAPSSISVQHLSQLGVNPNPPLSPSDVPPATATREQILQRVQDPSSCQNRQECQVFCSSSSAAAAKCAEFARVAGAALYDGKTIDSDTLKLREEIRNQFGHKLGEFIARATFTGTTTPDVVGTSSLSIATSTWVYPEMVGRPSLADVIPVPVLEATVANPTKLASELPADVHSVGDFQSYCGSVEHIERCSKIINNIAPDLAPAVKKQEEVVQRVEQQATQVIEQRTGARIFTDTDGDGISDYDEINIFHTDPTKRDSFSSGYSDGATLLSQSSGAGATAGTTTSPQITLLGGLAVENPKITGTTQANILNVASVASVELKENAEGKKEVSKALFKGKALPNSFVKVYFFSDPIVVTVKTDDQGNWSYILDKTLPDGAHTVYVAMVDNGGRILAKSSPLPFVKEASALTVEAAGPTVGTVTDKGMFGGLTPLALIALVVGVLGLGLSVVGAVIGIRHSNQSGGDTGLRAS